MSQLALGPCPGGKAARQVKGGLVEQRKEKIMIFWAFVLMSCFISLPPIMLIWMIDQNKPRYYGHLLYGIVFIIYSVLVFKGLTFVSVGIAEKFATYQSPPQNTINDFKNIKSNLDAWVYVIPAVIAAIGANLVTQFITTPKPQKS